MIKRSSLVAELKSRGYTHYREKRNVHLYRKAGDPYLVLPSKRQLTEDTACSILHQIGCSPKEIEGFIHKYRI